MKATPLRSSSAEINGLVSRYRLGDREAAEDLLSRFARYMGKWLRLLAAGRWDPRDKEVKHFLTMVGSVDLNNTAQILSCRLKNYEREDLEQEIRVALLETALRYGAIYDQFRFTLRRRVMALVRDPLVFDVRPRVELESVEIACEDGEELGPAWLEGLTCGKGFDELTREERTVLLYNKHYGFSIEQTAKILGTSTSTVNRIIAHSKKILAVHYLG